MSDIRKSNLVLKTEHSYAKLSNTIAAIIYVFSARIGDEFLSHSASNNIAYFFAAICNFLLHSVAFRQYNEANNTWLEMGVGIVKFLFVDFVSFLVNALLFDFILKFKSRFFKYFFANNRNPRTKKFFKYYWNTIIRMFISTLISSTIDYPLRKHFVFSS